MAIFGIQTESAIACTVDLHSLLSSFYLQLPAIPSLTVSLINTVVVITRNVKKDVILPCANDVMGCIFNVTKGIFCGLLFPNMEEDFPYSAFFPSMKKEAGDLLVK